MSEEKKSVPVNLSGFKITTAADACADKREIKFPTQWEFRIIINADKFESASAQCVKILLDHDPGAEIGEGQKSAKGTYVTLRATAVVFDRDDLNELSSSLAHVDGVKMLI